jgi:hypothetical protein
MKKTYTFHVDITSELTGDRYEGSFTLRHASLADFGAISAAMSRLNHGARFVSDVMEAIIQAVATITVCSETAPEWWNSVADGDVFDTRVIMQINSAMLEARSNSKPFRSDESGSD